MRHTPYRVRAGRIVPVFLALVLAPHVAHSQGRLYWTEPDNPAIVSSNFDGSSKQTTAQGFALEWPVDLDIDQSTGWVYWADQGTNRISRISPNGRQGGVILLNSHAPFGVAVDGTNGHLYWTEKQAIKRSGLDGSNPVELVTAFEWPQALEIAVDDNLMFWTVSSGGTFRSKLDGTDIQQISTEGSQYLAVDNLDDEVFIPVGKSILKTTFIGVPVDTVVKSDNNIEAVTVEPGAHRLCWSETIPKGPGEPAEPARLMCGSTDGESITEIAKVEGTPLGLAINDRSRVIFLATFGPSPRIMRCHHDGSSLENLTSLMIQPVDVAVDATAGKVYWVDGRYPRQVVSRSDLDGRNFEDFPIRIPEPSEFGLDVLSAIAVDPLNANVYVGTEASVSRSMLSPGRIVMGPMEGLIGNVIEDEAFETIWDIEVDGERGEVYFVGRLGQLWRRNLDGSDPVQLKTGVGSGIAISPRSLYWLDLASQTLRRSNLDGSLETAVLSGVAEIRDLAVDASDRYLWWTIPGGKSVWRLEIGQSTAQEVVSGNTRIEGLFVVSTPSIVSLISPPADASDQPTSVPLTWTRPAGAQRFDVQVTSGANINDIIFALNTPNAEETFVAPFAESSYNWRVRSTGPGGEGPFTAYAKFTVGASGPLAATLLEPAENETGVVVDPTFRWTKAPDAIYHQLQVASNPSFTNPLIYVDSLGEDYYIAQSLDHETTYYWRVAGIAADGKYTFTAPKSFTTIVSAPQAITLVSPDASAEGVPAYATFSWQAAADADSYRFELAFDSLFEQILVDVQTPATDYALESPLAYDTRYFWRVSGINEGGEGAWSEHRAFRTVIGTGVAADGLPSVFALSQNFPNPFSLSTQIRYDLPRPEHVSVVVYDALGRQVERLVDSPQPAGSHIVTFEAGDHPGGLYVCRMQAGSFGSIASMVLAR
ncbi:MAG TPA: hypothetical protein VMO47_12320 [Rhodothermales bacterium]|nr:hypothetical protein [Rhodothermales bacterium]